MLSLVISVIFLIPTFAGEANKETTDNNIIDGGLEAMPIVIDDMSDYYQLIKMGRYEIVYNKAVVNQVFYNIEDDDRKVFKSLTNNDLHLSVTDTRKKAVYTNNDVVIKCRPLNDTNIKVTLKKIGKKHVKKSFIIVIST
jgi:hypothetical protein